MIHVAAFSGGKDSTAMILWMKEKGMEFTTVFCDTGWEHPLTYEYIDKINNTILNNSLIVLKSEKYSGFEDLVMKRKMVPGPRARFCTQELKIYPLHKFIEAQEDEVSLYQGIRADESYKRNRMVSRIYDESAGGYWIERPLFFWTAKQCFDLMKRHGVEPNPLYLKGVSRVGCFPCILVNHRDIKSYLNATPEIEEKVISLEEKLNEEHSPDKYRAFFQSTTIPAKHCSKEVTRASGRKLPVPTAKDVFTYIKSVKKSKLPLVKNTSCTSVYNLCE